MDNNGKWLTKKPIAHRGLHNKSLPENSIGAFVRAANRGFAIEMDVQMSRDGEVFAFHDKNLQAMTGRDDFVSALKASEIKRLRLNKTEYTVPLLADVLSEVSGRVPILIDIKNEGLPGKLEDTLSRVMSKYNGEFAFHSFNPMSLLRIKSICHGVPRGQIVSRFIGENMPAIKRRILSKISSSSIGKPDFLSVDIDDQPVESLQERRERGIALIGWTISSPERLNAARCYCDNIIFTSEILEAVSP